MKNRPIGDSPLLGDGLKPRARSNFRRFRPKGDCPQSGDFLFFLSCQFLILLIVQKNPRNGDTYSQRKNIEYSYAFSSPSILPSYGRAATGFLCLQKNGA